MYWDWREEISFILGLIGLIPFCLADDLINSRRFFRYCVAISVPWFLLGLAFAYLNPLDLDPPLVVGISAFPAIHLLTFESLRQIFRNLTGKNPCITTVSSIRGKHATGGLFSRYPKGRRIRNSDFVFTIFQALIPFVILFSTWILAFPPWKTPTPPIQTKSELRYPAHWSAPINDPNKPAWEILPQEAKAGEVILSKRG